MPKKNLIVRVEPDDEKRARAKSDLLAVDDGIKFAARVRFILKKFIEGKLDDFFKTP